MSAPQKPVAAKEPVPNPDVCKGDEVYFRHAKGPHAARVTAVGKHGITVHHEGKPHPVRWEHVLGHKTRKAQKYDVLDEGEDGLIVADAAGQRRYITVPPEARGEKMVLSKAHGAGGPRMVLFAKAGPIANRPGLSLQQQTDKNGVQSKHWVRTNKALPKGRPSHVGFENGEHKGHGKVVASGKDGHTVEDAAGGRHQVRHEHVTHQWEGKGAPKGSPHDDGPAHPDWAPRTDGEDDKAYAKRVVDKGDAVEKLPEQHDRYFHTEGSTHVELDKLHSTKSDEDNKKGGDNGPKRMLAAYHGKLGKRDPITVMPHAEKDGHFEVVDGNGTLTSAKKMGWKGLPTKVVSREDGERLQAEDAKKEADKAKKPQSAEDIASALFSHTETAKLPDKAFQPVDSWEQLHEKGVEGLKQFKSMLGEVAKVLDLETGRKPKSLDISQETENKEAAAAGREPEQLDPQKYMLPEHWDNDKGFLFMGKLKGEARAKQKVESEYGGEWSKVRDMVRATIAVPSVTQLPKVLKELKNAGIELAQKPKNNLVKPLPGGYRDLNLIVKLPNGMVAELQVHVKPMTVAKGIGHKHYEVSREIEAKYQKHGTGDDPTKWEQSDREKHAAAMKEQEKIYGAAWEKASSDEKPSSNLTKSQIERRIVLLKTAGDQNG